MGGNIAKTMSRSERRASWLELQSEILNLPYKTVVRLIQQFIRATDPDPLPLLRSEVSGW